LVFTVFLSFAPIFVFFAPFLVYESSPLENHVFGKVRLADKFNTQIVPQNLPPTLLISIVIFIFIFKPV
jgi:hypothetical protein